MLRCASSHIVATANRVVLGVALLGLAAMALHTAACSEGSEPTPTGGGGTSAAGGFATSDCGLCVSDACAAERTACAADPSCAAYLGCLEACPVAAEGNIDASCAAGCPAAQGTTGQDAQAAYDTCRLTGPGAACAACGIVPDDAGSDAPPVCEPPAVLSQDCSDVDNPDPCVECVYDHCCDSVADMTVGGPATDLYFCCADCNANVSCLQDCYEAHPDGIADFGGYWACHLVVCIGQEHCEPAASACTQCIYEECGCELARCEVDPACHVALEACLPSCAGDVVCEAACRPEQPDSATAFDAYGVCASQRCGTQCG